MAVHSVAVLGAGNGGCAAAADLGARGFDVRLYNRSLARLEPLIRRGGLERRGSSGEGFVELSLMTDDLAAAVAGADLVMLTVPVSAHAFFARELGKVLPEDGVVFLNPGHIGGGLFVANEIYRLTGRTDVRTGEVSTLSYACRMRGPAAIDVFAVHAVEVADVFPARAVVSGHATLGGPTVNALGVHHLVDATIPGPS